MTLIIGFKCEEGIVLVSDTKIINVVTGEHDYGSKILTPLLEKMPFIIGAAGYTNLFREFNRKIPLLVDQRLKEFVVKNIEALMKTNLTREKAIEHLQIIDEQMKKETQIQGPIEFKTKSETKYVESEEVFFLPYIYSIEYFLDDCKALIKKISTQFVEFTPYPLEVLVGHKAIGLPPTLHLIDAKGHEQEIDLYASIGAGSPFVKKFFDRLYNYDKDMNYLITLSFTVITYVQCIAKENSVGFSSEFPPEAVVVYNDGSYGRIRFDNESDVLKDIKEKIKSFEETISFLDKIKPLELEKDK